MSDFVFELKGFDGLTPSDVEGVPKGLKVEDCGFDGAPKTLVLVVEDGAPKTLVVVFENGAPNTLGEGFDNGTPNTPVEAG